MDGDPTGRMEPFEHDLAELLGDAIRNDEPTADAVNRALCNVTWTRADGATAVVS